MTLDEWCEVFHRVGGIHRSLPFLSKMTKELFKLTGADEDDLFDTDCCPETMAHIIYCRIASKVVSTRASESSDDSVPDTCSNAIQSPTDCRGKKRSAETETETDQTNGIPSTKKRSVTEVPRSPPLNSQGLRSESCEGIFDLF